MAEVTLIMCALKEPWCYLDGIDTMAELAAEDAAREHRDDVEARLNAPCEACRVEEHEGLQVVGGLALCSACIGASLNGGVS